MARQFPRAFYNYVTLTGVGLALFGLAAIAIFWVMDTFLSEGSNPYLGIIMLVVLPGFLILGLILIPIGAVRQRRLRAAGRPRRVLTIDIENPAHRRVMTIFGVGTAVFLLLSTMGMYTVYEFTESVEFCGETCHHVMGPELAAFQDSPHAGTHCVDCHVGSGADSYIRSKLSGTRQLWQVIKNDYAKPIKVPIHPPMGSGERICQACHWPGKDQASTLHIFDHFLGDSANTPWTLGMLFHVGGTAEGERHEAGGIHWHNDPAAKMQFVAADEELSRIIEVTWWKDGNPVVYTPRGIPLSDHDRAEAETDDRVRFMDCIDCHNRPAHNYKSPMLAVNEALAWETLDPKVPWIKREAVAALSSYYETSAGARDSVTIRFREGLARRGVTPPPASVATMDALFQRNLFPDMKVRWRDYPDHRGHLFNAGCMRAHGSELSTPTGERISSECETCHTVVLQGPPDQLENWSPPKGLEFRHPIEIAGGETMLKCYECHIGDESVYLNPDGDRTPPPNTPPGQ